MYDEFNLKALLSEIGFSNIKRMFFKSSNIENWDLLGLDLGNNGDEYKAGSLYMEASK